MWFGRVVVLCVFVASAYGCGSSDSASQAPVDCTHGCWQPTAADEQYLTDLCTLTESCCVKNTYRDASDVEGCKTIFRSAGLTHDESVRKACLDEMKSLVGNGISCVPEVWNLSDACMRLTYEPSGPQVPGGPCTKRADCAGAPGTITFCTQVSSAVSPTFGICLRLTPGQAGSDEPCLGSVTPDGLIVAAPLTVPTSETPISTGPICEARKGLYCGPGPNNGWPWTCQVFSSDGASCQYDGQCASQQCLTSDGSDASSDHPGTCTKRVPAGQTCDDYYSGAPLTVCDATTYCQEHDMSGTCVPKLAAGSTCNNDADCVSDNCDDTDVCSTQTSDEKTALFGFCLRL